MKHRSGLGDSPILPTTDRPSTVNDGTSGPRRGFISKILWFLRQFGLDVLTIIVIGIVALVIDKYVPPYGGRVRYFRLLPGQGSTSPQMEEFGHRYRKQIITFWLSAALDICAPLVIISTLELFTHGRFTSFARGMLGALNSVITCCFIQIILKTFAGGFRPNFLELCQPQPNGPGFGFDGTWYKWTICTGDPEKINWALESFPSGHVATSFAAGVYLSLYINAKLKVFADYRSSPLTVVFCLGPLTLATLMGGAVSADTSHHWYDIIGGAILGTLVAFTSYRNSHASIFDPRTNHIGLEPSRRFLNRPEYDEQVEYDARFGFPIFSSSRISG